MQSSHAAESETPNIGDAPSDVRAPRSRLDKAKEKLHRCMPICRQPSVAHLKRALHKAFHKISTPFRREADSNPSSGNDLPHKFEHDLEYPEEDVVTLQDAAQSTISLLTQRMSMDFNSFNIALNFGFEYAFNDVLRAIARDYFLSAQHPGICAAFGPPIPNQALIFEVKRSLTLELCSWEYVKPEEVDQNAAIQVVDFEKLKESARDVKILADWSLDSTDKLSWRIKCEGLAARSSERRNGTATFDKMTDWLPEHLDKSTLSRGLVVQGTKDKQSISANFIIVVHISYFHLPSSTHEGEICDDG